MITLMIITLIISNIMMMIASLLSKKTFMDREKTSPFECGFDPKSSARIPFSLQFFLIAMMFLIFDIEITLILPFIYSMKTINMTNMIITYLSLIAILLVGLLHEWNQGMLNWAF
nr:NADH dehydrogenase subunit 3 [Melasis buprestoides]